MMNKLLFLMLTIGILAGVAYASGTTLQAPQEPTTAIHTVAPGETLWNIAQLYSPQADPRKAVYIIRKVNNMHNSPVVYPGQQILVPVNLR
jgi:LysM repeat protein